jgi:hypothetical protein
MVRRMPATRAVEPGRGKGEAWRKRLLGREDCPKT